MLEGDLADQFQCLLQAKLHAFLPLAPAAVACNEHWIAFPGSAKSDRRSLELIRLENGLVDFESCEQFQISTEHCAKILAVRFASQNLMISASKDALYRWNLLPNGLEQPWGQLLKSNIGPVSHLSSAGDSVAACIDQSIHIINIPTGRLLYLDGHQARVTCTEFFPAAENSVERDWLVSVSEDRTFKVWDIANRCCLYQSAILSPVPLTSVACDPCRRRICIASEEGQMFFFDWTPRLEGGKCEPRCLTVIDISKTMEQLNQSQAESKKEGAVEYVSSVAPWRRKTFAQDPAPVGEVEERIQHSHAVIGMRYCQLLPKYIPHDGERTEDKGQHSLVIGCCSGLLLMNPASYEIQFYTRYPDQMGLAGTYAFSGSSAVVVGNILGGELNILSIRERRSKAEKPKISVPPNVELSLPSLVQASVEANVKGTWAYKIYRQCMTDLANINIRTIADLGVAKDHTYPPSIPPFVQAELDRVVRDRADEDELTFSMVNITTFDASSPIKPKEVPLQRAAIKRALKSKKTLQDHPVTFHTKVKSSGYLQAPKATQLFTHKKTAAKPRKGARAQFTAEYPMDCKVMTNPMKLPLSSFHAGPITGVKFNHVGNAIATCSTDRSIRFQHIPPREQAMKALVGHDGPIASVFWSHSNCGPFDRLILSAGLDGTARLWSVRQSDPLIELRQLRGKKGTGPTSIATLPKDVKSARFYFRDKFIVVPGPSIYLFTYKLEKQEPNSIRPQLNQNSYSLVKALRCSAQSVTSLACINTYQSHLILSAGSDKSLNVWDVANCQIVRSIEQAQTRAIHAIAVADYDINTANVFATSAVTDSIKLWDIRHKKPSMHLHGHVNRHAAVGCAISPCGRFLASGSEDNHAYVYDIRQGTIVARIGGHTDVVSDVDFNPATPTLATGCYDGKVRLFTS